MKSALTLCLLLLFGACVSPVQPEPVIPAPIAEEKPLKFELLDPIETREPNTGFSPAFAGQTRAPGTRSGFILSVSILNDQLVAPWGIEVLPSGQLIITEKQGRLAVLDQDGAVLARIEGFPRLNPEGQGGLLDLAISPGFEQDSTLYFTFSAQTDQGSATALGRAVLNPADWTLTEVKTLFVATPYLSGVGHYGSRIAFDDHGNIFLSTGDRQETNRRMFAQDPAHNLGKIHVLTPEGKPVEGYDSSVYSLGHRNVQGVAYDPINRVLWANEMGPQGGDELNLIEAGGNYGWPIVSYGEEYSGEPIGDGIAQKEGMIEPRYYWDPVISPSGMIFYTGEMFREWQNNLIIAGLKAEALVRLVVEGDKVIAEEHLLKDQAQRFRDIAQGIDGSLYAITDSGRLYHITR